MAQFYRKLNDPTVYEDEAMTRGIKDEAQLRSLGGIPDWGTEAANTNIRTLDGLSGGQSATFERAPQNNSYSIFNNALMEMLKSYQSMGTRPAQEQSLDLSTQQAQRGMEQATPGMSPGQQAAVRNASQSALTPSIQGAENRAQTFSEQLSGFKGVLQQTQAMGQALQDQQFKIQENARKMVNDSIQQFGSQAFEGVSEQELAQVEKEAGLPKGYLLRTAKTLKEQELAQKQQAQEAKYASGSIGEYQFYADQEKSAGRTPMGYNEYQNMDANRKRSISNTYIGGSGMDAKQTAIFNSIADKANKSPLVAAKDRTVILENAIENIKKDPGNGALQLNLSYSYIQALDTYQSAVREGELRNINTIDSKVGNIQGYLQNIQNGQIVRPEVALNIANAAQEIVTTIKKAADAKIKQFGAQAEIAGVGNAWNEYQGLITQQNTETPTATGNIEQDLDNDITGAMSQFQTREQLIEALTGEYPEIDKQTIANRVYSLIGDNNQIK